MLFEEDENNEETEENEIEENDEEIIYKQPCWICGRKGHEHDLLKHSAWFWSKLKDERGLTTEEKLLKTIEYLDNLTNSIWSNH